MNKKESLGQEPLVGVPKRDSSGYSVIFLLGPTAVGKTDLSFYLAEKLSASILNCDSIQMYKGLDVGSAKPVEENKKHTCFLFDEWEPPFTCTAGEFRKKALAILERELAQRSVLAVGGSGFYIQALEKGMYSVKPIKPEIKTEVRKMYKEKGLAHLYKMLQFLDPKYAKQISPQDKYRIFRGTCLVLSEEKPVSLIRSSFQAQRLPWPYLKIGLHLPREVLLKNVQFRTDKMIEGGLLEEVQGLLKKGLADWPIMKSVGYKEAVLYLQHKITKEEMKMHITNRTMQLAKKQISWFKRDKSIKWYVSERKNWPVIYQRIKERTLD